MQPHVRTVAADRLRRRPDERVSMAAFPGMNRSPISAGNYALQRRGVLAY